MKGVGTSPRKKNPPMRNFEDADVVRISSLAADVSVAAQGAAEVTPEQVEAVLEAMFLMAVVDGEVSEIEIRQFARSCEPLVGEVSEGDVEGTLMTMAGTLADEGWPKRVEAVGKVLAGSAVRDQAFRLAVAVALVDDYVANAEAAAIDALSSALSLGAEHSDALVKQVYGELFGAL
jgi:hypothetical protein